MIDALITYVNCADQLWYREYAIKTKTHNPTPTRFRSWGTLKYLMRGIAEYMPFVRNIILVVSAPSQVPIWINQENVRVVYHKDFIPAKYLPTFNSCTIESFFWNIPNLADKIIYFNDDMFPTGPMSEEDFFTDDTPHIKFSKLELSKTANLYRHQCRSGMDLMTTALNLPEWQEGQIIRPYHITTAFTKEGLDAVGELCGDLIPNTISTLRASTNVNQYIYAYWHYFTDNYIPETIKYNYFELMETTFSEIADTIATTTYQMVCLNDSDKIKSYPKLRQQLQDCFEKKFPNKCKYEI